MNTRVCSALVPFVLVCASATARAAGNDAAAALALFNEGRDLMKAGRYADACPKLAESARLDPKVGTFGKLGECEEQTHHLANARAHWKRAVDLARQWSDPRLKDAEAELARIDAAVPKLRIDVTARAEAETVAIDDVAVDGAAAVAVDPGTHVITAIAPGRKSWATSVETRADGAVVPVVVPALDPVQDTRMAASTSADAPANGRPKSLLPTVGIAAAAAGVVAIGIGAYYGLQAQSLQSDAGCPSNQCPNSSAGAKLWDAKSAADTSTLFFVAGVLLAGSGAAMWLLAPSAGESGAGVVARRSW